MKFVKLDGCRKGGYVAMKIISRIVLLFFHHDINVWQFSIDFFRVSCFVSFLRNFQQQISALQPQCLNNLYSVIIVFIALVLVLVSSIFIHHTPLPTPNSPLP